MMSATSRLQFLPAASCVSCLLQQSCAQKQGLQSALSSTRGLNRWRESATRGARFSSGVARVTCAAMKYNNLGWSEVKVSEVSLGFLHSVNKVQCCGGTNCQPPRKFVTIFSNVLVNLSVNHVCQKEIF